MALPAYFRGQLRPFLLAAAALAGLGLFVGGVVFWSGAYNISADKPHWKVTEWMLRTARNRSIKVRSRNTTPPSLNEDGLVSLGAEYFRSGCASCHGYPGQLQGPIAAQMLPRPPDLLNAAKRYSAGELHWIIDNGLKFTGMPAWPADKRRDEIWAVVAYLLRVHERGIDMSDSSVSVVSFAPATRRALRSAVPPRDPSRAPLATLAAGLADSLTPTSVLLRASCRRCHGDADTPPVGPQVPSLNGQSRPYLTRALREYAARQRVSGYMAPVSHALTSADINNVARWYASLTPLSAHSADMPANTPDNDAGDALQLGKTIAERGLPQHDIPACSSCHHEASTQFPDLHGQSAPYLAQQLRLFQTGGRNKTGYATIMATIASRLSPAQLRAVSLYYATLQAEHVHHQ